MRKNNHTLKFESFILNQDKIKKRKRPYKRKPLSYKMSWIISGIREYANNTRNYFFIGIESFEPLTSD